MKKKIELKKILLIMFIILTIITVILYIKMNTKKVYYETVRCKIEDVDIKYSSNGRHVPSTTNLIITVSYKGKNYKLLNDSNSIADYKEGRKITTYFSNGKMYANINGIKTDSSVGTVYFIFLFIDMWLLIGVLIAWKYNKNNTFNIKVIDDRERKFTIKIGDISNVKKILNEIWSKLNYRNENMYYTIKYVKKDNMLKYTSDNKIVKIGYIASSKNKQQIILTTEENYLKYYADKYNISEFDIICQKYFGCPINVTVQVNREQLAFGDDVNLTETFVIKPDRDISVLGEIGSYAKYYKRIVMNYTDFAGKEISLPIREDGKLLLSNNAFSNFVESYRINIDKPIIIQQFKN